MKWLLSFGVLLIATSVMVEGVCDIYQTNNIQIDFCNFAEIVTSIVPGLVSSNQLILDCSNSDTLIQDALALLDNIINDNQCVDPCSSNPCVQGTCIRITSQEYQCSCNSGYAGFNCDVDIDECASSPCVNGLCVNVVGGFQCTCDAGFGGERCDTDIDECLSNPCANNGVCQDQINGYTCQCAPGFDGLNCDNDIDECLSNPCVNGVCLDQVNGYTCQCTPGYDGLHCDNDIDECLSNPCVNGVCQNHINNYTCLCDPGFHGRHCDYDINECESSPCVNGYCTDLINGFQCQCDAGFDGDRCEIDIDDCASNPCVNGQCVDFVNYFHCECDVGYSGERCDMVEGSGPECYVEDDGSDYRGTIAMTKSGYDCQNWANTHPQHVSDFDHFLFRDHENYCRNYPGSGRTAPWCYTTVEEVEWEYCLLIPKKSDVCTDKPAIPDFDTLVAEFAAITDYDRAECYTDDTGLDYTGYVDVTIEGYKCQRWDVNYPQKRSGQAKKAKPRFDHIRFGSHNYCRNMGSAPDGTATGPWCWIADTSAGKTWDYCDTGRYKKDSCDGKGTAVSQLRYGVYPECYLLGSGTDYAGDLSITEAGETCQNWADLGNSYAQTFGDLGNKCRNVDGSGLSRVFCYVNNTKQTCAVKDYYDGCYIR
ncbi:uncharacterized protein [Diadema antillarum]|uniref:uncharacterized protein n=1 Tax=Diadema antillarum TaxID=105358 RepID=UPI003A8BDC35